MAVYEPPSLVEAIAEARETLERFDNVPLTAYTPLFYEQAYNELDIALRDLLHALDREPDAHPPAESP